MRTIPARSTALSVGLTAGLLATVATVAAAPAHAASTLRNDADDTSHGSDIGWVAVTHRDRDVVVVSQHADLRPDPASGSGGSLFIDTDPADAGPEYVLVGGWYDGTDYVLVATEGWSTKQWGEPVEGAYRQRVDHDRDRVRTVISRAALGDPEEVRVALRASGPAASTRDWVRAPRSFTAWVARG